MANSSVFQSLRRGRASPAKTLLYAIHGIALSVTACSVSRPAAPVPESEAPVYRTVLDSIYLKALKSGKLGVVRTHLDTNCSLPQCESIMRRWGLDSMWWESRDREAALDMRRTIVQRAAQGSVVADSEIVQGRVIDVTSDLAASAHSSVGEWQNFRHKSGVVAIIRFSPIGYSRDRSQALLVVQMQCGPGCGHGLTVLLSRSNGLWRIKDQLLLKDRQNDGDQLL
jgi:hypothetical protein